MNAYRTASEDSQLTPEEIDGSFVLIQDVFRQVRPLLLERAGKVEYTSKHDGSPVTDTDVEVEKILQEKLASHFPHVPVFGEESGYGDDLPESFWLLDPIDGTESFVQNIPAFTCMGVFIQGGEATMSVIYNPSTDDMYTAQKGKGAFKNDVRLDLHAVQTPPMALCKERFVNELNSLLTAVNVRCEQKTWGGGYGFAMVAEGQVAARFNLHGRGQVHDYATGALLVREAGGVLVPISEDAYSYESRCFVACHPKLEPIIRSMVPKLRELEAAK